MTLKQSPRPFEVPISHKTEMPTHLYSAALISPQQPLTNLSSNIDELINLKKYPGSLSVKELLKRKRELEEAEEDGKGEQQGMNYHIKSLST